LDTPLLWAHPLFVGKKACTERPTMILLPTEDQRMYLTEEEIQKLGEKHMERLRSAQTKLPDGSMTVSEIQRWMIGNNIESPEILETMISKQGTGAGTGKKKDARSAEQNSNIKVIGLEKSTQGGQERSV
jgi:hypothetical protein